MKPHLEAFHTRTVLVPGIEIKLRITFNSPEFFCVGARMTDKKYPTLGPNDIQAKFYLCRLTLNPTTCAALTKRRHNKGMWARYLTVYMDVRTFTFYGESTIFKKTSVSRPRTGSSNGGITGQSHLQRKFRSLPFCLPKVWGDPHSSNHMR